MSQVLARFKRGEDRVKLVSDMEPGYHYIITNPEEGPTRVERFRSLYLFLHLELYEANGYQRLKLCPVCKGSGQRWYQEDRDICEACQGEGGIL